MDSLNRKVYYFGPDDRTHSAVLIAEYEDGTADLVVKLERNDQPYDYPVSRAPKGDRRTNGSWFESKSQAG
jgi:hypothetical protein